MYRDSCMTWLGLDVNCGRLPISNMTLTWPCSNTMRNGDAYMITAFVPDAAESKSHVLRGDISIDWVWDNLWPGIWFQLYQGFGSSWGFSIMYIVLGTMIMKASQNAVTVNSSFTFDQVILRCMLDIYIHVKWHTYTHMPLTQTWSTTMEL